MASLFVDRHGAELEAASGVLTVRGQDGSVMRTPIAPLERVVVRGPVRIASSALTALHGQGASLLVLGGRRSEASGCMLGPGHADTLIRLGQLRLATEPATRAAIARAVVRHKIAGQHRLLRHALSRRPDRRYPLLRAAAALTAAAEALSCPEAPSVPQMMGIEGAAAAAYFEGFTTLFPPAVNFHGRNRRPPRDPVNAALSLGYTLATFEAAREAWKAGLDPAIGFLHAPRSGRDGLACDLVEPLRPFVDRMVWRLFAEEQLRAAHFTRDGDACLMGKAGRLAFYTAWEDAAEPARRRLRRGLRHLVTAARAAAAGLFDHAPDAAS